MSKETDFDKAVRLKGYGDYDKKIKISQIQQIHKVGGNLKVQPTVISSVSEYLDFINKLDTLYTNPVFYRGQGNANFLVTPNVLRINHANENLMLEAFRRRFSKEVNSCVNDMARLVLMQHFGLSTRALDVSENPLAALYFACSPMKKFCKNREEEMSHWGEVIVFREPEDIDESSKELKPIHSSTVSVMASTAFMENDFSLWKLGMEWKKDNNLMREEKYIPLKSIICCSKIVRVPQDNQRIKNQQGAFILVNANQVKQIPEKDEKADELTEYILKSNENITFDELTKDSYWKNCFGKLNTWDLEFTKIEPYSGDNRINVFDTDPFDLQRLLYKDKNGVQQVALIPPECKEKIIKGLARFNVTEDFIYPDMDNVAHEIGEQYSKNKDE